MPSRRSFLKQGVGAAAAAAAATSPLNAVAQHGGESSRPNIIIFLADDLGYSDIGCFGSEISTPNLDALASHGLRLSQYYNNPRCCPSRASILTGCYNLRNGAMFNQQRPKAEVKKWPAYFQALGYEVVAIGKVAHYAQVTTYGFDHAAFYNYHQDVCVDKAVEWLAARKSPAARPLCLIVGTNFPHVPWPKQGMLTPDVQYDYPDTTFLLFFVFHGGIIAGVLYLTFGLKMRPYLQHLPRVIAWSFVYMGVAGAFDWLSGANYGLLRTKPPYPLLRRRSPRRQCCPRWTWCAWNSDTDYWSLPAASSSCRSRSSGYGARWPPNSASSCRPCAFRTTSSLSPTTTSSR